LDAEEALAALAGETTAAPPAEPPAGAQSFPVERVAGDSTVLAFTNRNAQVIWVKTDAGFSDPVVVSRARLWWASADTAAPSEEIRLFGKGLGMRNVQPILALRSVDSGAVRRLEMGSGQRNGSYERRAVLPDDLPPGDYEVFVHNGRGLASSWSDPVGLRVELPEASEAERTVVNVMDHGAVGDGRSDDTEAILRAVAAAEKVAPATVYLPEGVYGLRRTIKLPEGVDLRGLSRESTALKVPEEQLFLSDFPFDAEFEGFALDWIRWWQGMEDLSHAAMIWVRNDSLVSDLHLRLGPGAPHGILVGRAPGVAENVVMENLKITGLQARSGEVGSVGIRVMGDTRKLIVRNNEFTGVALHLNANRHERTYIGYNKAVALQHGHPHQGNNMVFIRGTRHSIIEENDIRNGDRNIVFQAGTVWSKNGVPEGMRNAQAPAYHTALIGNRFTDNIPRRHNGGEIMIEGGYTFWQGSTDAIAEKSLTVDEAPFNSDLVGHYVLSGPGIGQYRRIVEHDARTLWLGKPWRVVPGKESHLVVGNFMTEFLWIDNTEENISGFTGFWGNHLGHVISGLISRNGGGPRLWPNRPMSVIAFVDIEHNWISERGQVMLRGKGATFGNTIFGNEIIDFRYGPQYHGTTRWRNARAGKVEGARGGMMNRAGVHLITEEEPTVDLGGNAPVRDWNIIEANLIDQGRVGIEIDPGARDNLVTRNVTMDVEKPFIDKGVNTWVGSFFDGEE